MRPTRASAEHANTSLKRVTMTRTAKAKAVDKKSVHSGSSRKKSIKRGSVHLSAYFKSYKGGLGDFHIPVFRDLKRLTSAQRVLYPGCHRHITASLVFENVVYVDNYVKIKPVFTDAKVLQFIKDNKEFQEEPVIEFKCKNFEADFGEKVESFDLLLSLSAGIVSKPCAKYLQTGGFLLASDAHFDARMAFIDPQFEFIAVYNDNDCKFDTSEEAKHGHFMTKKGELINMAMVQESIDLPKAKRHFKLEKESLFYLFKKK